MKINLLTAVIITGAAVTATYVFTQPTETGGSAEPKPLYWVAPMDPSYRRDAPGKSPMGMDLIPVYEETGSSQSLPTITSSVQQNLGVKIAQTREVAVRDTIKASGLVEFNKSLQWDETVHLDAWVDSVNVTDIGQDVKTGEVLYTLYSHELITAQENLILARNQNNKTLYDAAKQRLLQFDIAQSTIAIIEERKQVLNPVPILAKRDGIVTTLSVSPGQFVQSGQTLLSVQHPSKRWITAELYAAQPPSPLSHYQAFVLPRHPRNDEIIANILTVLPSVDHRSRKPVLRLAIEDTQLQSGDVVEVEIRSRHTRTVLIVPQSALVTDGHTTRVAKWLGDGNYRFIEVELGNTYQDQVEVQSGLRLGDSVITNGQFLLDSESLLSGEIERSQLDAQPDSVWVMAEVVSATPDFGIVEVHHAPISEWSWPAMTMSFEVLDPALWPQLKQGQSVHMRITATQFGYGIVEVMMHGDTTGGHQGHTMPESSIDITPPSMDHNHKQHTTATGGHGDHHDQ